jgi:DNA-binding PadR family transcriptional regulator
MRFGHHEAWRGERMMRGGPGGFGGPHGWHAHGGGRRRLFDSGEFRLVLLKLIAEEPRHGYDLIRAIEALTGGAYAPSPGVIYPTITMLQDMSLIEEAKAEGTRKAYAITAEGEAHLAERADEVTALLARLAAIGAREEKTASGPVRRAMQNLRTALRDRLARDEADTDVVYKAAALLDEAAQKIERL